MSSRPPSISVLMTVFNAGRFLDASIRSIHRQAFQDWEMLVVDDASTDGSDMVAARWAETDPRIRQIRNAANKGQTACLNQGLCEARGKWIARQDADDLSHPLRLTRQFERAACNPELALIGTCGRIIDANGRLTGLLDMPLSDAAIRRTAAVLNPFLHTAVMFRRDVVMGEFGGYDGRHRISQDYDLWVRILARHPAANLPGRFVCYRNLATAISKTGRSTAFDEAREISRAAEEMSFRRTLSPCERAIVDAFREGTSSPDQLRAFQTFFDALMKPLDCPDRAVVLAGQRLRMAGRRGDRAAALRDVLSAFRWAPGFTIRWLAERLAG